MIFRKLIIGHWTCDFYFAGRDGYDVPRVMWHLKCLDAPETVLEEAEDKMLRGALNEGFTWSDIGNRHSVVVVGPAESGGEFLDTVVHELGHLADHIAGYLGISLDSEQSRYMLGDAARELAEVICRMGCESCNPGH